MDHLPLSLQLASRRVALIGGGAVALRKARLLKRAGARLRIVAPSISTELRALASAVNDELFAAEFAPAHLDDCWLAVAATERPDVNAAVFAAANERRMFCNSVDDVGHSSAQFPALIDRSPLVVAISSGGRAPVLVRRWRERIERLLPPGLGELARFIGARRRLVAERLPELSKRRLFWERLLDSPLAERLLARRRDGVERDFKTALDDARASAPSGMAWLVGAGPGAGDLITLRGLRALQDADVVVHDRLVGPEVLELARRDAEFIAVGKRAGGRGTSQDEINRLLVERVGAGQRVCRLKGGDPFVFARGGEELDALREAGLAVSVVPGITAAQGAAAAAGIPLTHRELSHGLRLVSAHDANDSPRRWQNLAASGDTLAFYMGVAGIERIRDRLLAAGMAPSTPFAAIERATTPAERVVSGEVATMPEVARRAALSAPALIIVGDVARYAARSRSAMQQHQDSPAPTRFARAGNGAHSVELPAMEMQP